MRVERYGCISGSDGSLAHLQCQVKTLKFATPSYMACCPTDYCNDDLPEPDPDVDPRWLESAPATESADNLNSSTFTILMVIATVMVTLICCIFYKIGKLMLRRHWITVKKDKNNCKSSTNTTDYSAHSFTVNMNQHLGGQSEKLHDSSAIDSASTNTRNENGCMFSDSSRYVNPSPEPVADARTLLDMTSGRGTRVLTLRTMARVIDLSVTVPIGDGRFGRVFKGSYHGEDVAVKAFKAIDCESFSHEEKILRKLNHENIVRYIASEQYSSIDNCSETWMFLDFYSCGSLYDFLNSNKIRNPQQAVKILLSIIRGLNYLHEDYSSGLKPPIAHRDIKSKNILMQTPDKCCLADFGHALLQVDENTLDFGLYNRFQVGTVRYMAPEILRPDTDIYDTEFLTFAKADLYQFGLILWEVCQRTEFDSSHPCKAYKLPYEGVVPPDPSIDDMTKVVCDDNNRPPIFPYWDRNSVMKELGSLMVECWRSNPKARMETLGIKKKIKFLHDRVTATQAHLDDPPTNHKNRERKSSE